MRVIDVLGQPTRVLTLGLDERRAGEPVLLLQAAAGSRIELWGAWAMSAAELAPVIAYDRVGVGESPFDGVELSFDRISQHAHDMLGVLGVEPPYVLVGHSWGGPLNLFFAARYPDEVAGLVYLDATPARLTPMEWVGASTESESRERWQEWEAVSAEEADSPAEMAQVRFGDSFLRTPLEDRGVPADPDVPTAAVLGTRPRPVADPSMSFEAEWAEHMIRTRLATTPVEIGTMRQGTVLIASDAGHSVYLDDPLLALEAVRRVLSQIAAQVDPETLRSYVGEYRFTSAFSIVVTLESDGLAIQPTNQGKYAILPRSTTRFFMDGGIAEFSFVVEDGVVTSMIFHQRGRDRLGEKIR